MGWEKSSFSVQSLACAKGHTATLDQIKISNGRCKFCRTTRFRVSILRNSVMVDTDPDPSLDSVLEAAAFKALAGGTLSPGTTGGMSRTEYELADVEGAELLKAMAGPPKETAAWIQRVRVADARAHLRPDQKICATCDTIFTPPRYGPNRDDDYCSPRCRTPASPAAAVPNAPKVVDVPCPGCGRVLRLRSGMRGKAVACTGCGTKFPGPQ